MVLVRVPPRNPQVGPQQDCQGLPRAIRSGDASIGFVIVGSRVRFPPPARTPAPPRYDEHAEPSTPTARNSSTPDPEPEPKRHPHLHRACGGITIPWGTPVHASPGWSDLSGLRLRRCKPRPDGPHTRWGSRVVSDQLQALVGLPPRSMDHPDAISL